MKLRNKTFWKINCLISAIILSGCEVVSPAATFVGATTGIVLDDKLPTDFIAEAFTGKDCSYIRQLDDGGPLCRSADYGKVIEKPVYCYASLGGTTCYNQPDPYGDGKPHIQ